MRRRTRTVKHVIVDSRIRGSEPAKELSAVALIERPIYDLKDFFFSAPSTHFLENVWCQPGFHTQSRRSRPSTKQILLISSSIRSPLGPLFDTNALKLMSPNPLAGTTRSSERNNNHPSDSFLHTSELTIHHTESSTTTTTTTTTSKRSRSPGQKEQHHVFANVTTSSLLEGTAALLKLPSSSAEPSTMKSSSSFLGQHTPTTAGIMIHKGQDGWSSFGSNTRKESDPQPRASKTTRRVTQEGPSVCCGLADGVPQGTTMSPTTSTSNLNQQHPAFRPCSYQPQQEEGESDKAQVGLKLLFAASLLQSRVEEEEQQQQQQEANNATIHQSPPISCVSSSFSVQQPTNGPDTTATGTDWKSALTERSTTNAATTAISSSTAHPATTTSRPTSPLSHSSPPPSSSSTRTPSSSDLHNVQDAEGTAAAAAAAAVGKDDMSIASTPTNADVLCGRGGLINKHPGNIVYRRIVDHNKKLYKQVPKRHRNLVSQSIVRTVLNQGGRFLWLQEQEPQNDQPQPSSPPSFHSPSLGHGDGGSSNRTHPGSMDGDSPSSTSRRSTATKKKRVLQWTCVPFVRAVQKTSQALREPLTQSLEDDNDDDEEEESCSNEEEEEPEENENQEEGGNETETIHGQQQQQQKEEDRKDGDNDPRKHIGSLEPKTTTLVITTSKR